MLGEKRSILNISMLASDMVITILSFFVAYWLRTTSVFQFSWFSEAPLYPLWLYMKVLLLLLPLWWILYLRLGRYQPIKILGRYTFPLLPVYRVNVLGLLIAISIGYFLKVASVSRALVLLFFAVNCLLQTLWRLFLLAFLQRVYFHESDFRQVLVVGDARKISKLNGFISGKNEWGIKVIEVMEKPSPECLAAVLQQRVIDDVIFTIDSSKLSQIEDDITVCEQMGVGIHIVTEWFRSRASKAWMDDFYGVPMLTLSSTRRRPWELLIKRTIDIFLSGVGIIFLLPLMAVVGLIIKLTSPGPVLFAQTRCGLNGRLFKLYKFRSMVQDAEKRLESLKDRNEMTGPVFKIKDDPRLTPIGKFLRQTSLDELPQLYNVLKDDMSIIGPRPPLPEEVQKYKLWQRRRLSVTPGITCLWQISGRNDINFDQWMKLDMQYIDTWSFWLDLKILLLTIPVVLLQKGAR